MPMVRRWAVYRVDETYFLQVGSHPSEGLAAMEALRLASATGATHHIIEQIISRQAAVEQHGRPQVMQRF